jgi:hypothetical protein
MQDLVYEKTKRPELIALTKSAIKMATLRAHHVDFFSRDETSQLLTFTVDSTLQFTDFATIYTTLPRLRTPNFMQAEDVTSPYMPTENLEFVSNYKNMWNQDNELQCSVFCLHGATLRVRFAVPTGRSRLYCFLNPDTTEATYSSWIADNHADELAFWAAGIVWMRSGFPELAQQVQSQQVIPFKELLVASYLSSAHV